MSHPGQSGEASLPVVDVSPFFPENDGADPDLHTQRSRAVDEVRRACAEIGFLAVRLPEHLHFASVIAKARIEAKAFFALGQDEKLQCAANGNAYGYFPMQSEALGYEANVDKLPDIREAFSMGPDFPAPTRLLQAEDNGDDSQAAFMRRVADFCHQPTPWPAGNDRFEHAMQEFYDLSSLVGQVLLRIMAEALGLDPNHFDAASAAGAHANSARAIFYPQLREAAAKGQARCGAHSDTGALTLLWSDAPGLQVQHRSAGGGAEGAGADERLWVTARVPPDCLIVNIGDAMQKLSRGRWRSTPHRVPAPDVSDSEANQDRLVLVQFLILCADFEVDPASGLTQGEHLFSHFRRWGRNPERSEPAQGHRSDVSS